MIIGIVCADAHWGIGKNNDLLFHLKGDMKFFRETTTGQICVMGFNTLKSFPGGKPLKNRTNVVLCRVGEEPEGCVVYHSFEGLISAIRNYQADDRDVYVIGGGMMYKSMLPYYDKVYVTEVDAVDPDAQVFFPDLVAAGFKVEKESEVFSENGLSYKFVTYVR